MCSYCILTELLILICFSRDLQGSDILSKSDPICVTYIQPFGTRDWREYHRTEVIKDNHNPDFVSKVVLQYRFEEQQPLKFEIYDIDSNSRNLDDHDFLGFAVCNLGQIVSGGKVLKTASFYFRETEHS